MKCIIVCYSIHDKKIASYDHFDKEEDAKDFLKKDAQNTYEEEMNNSADEEKDKINFTLNDDSAYLSSCDGEYEWTWEIIVI